MARGRLPPHVQYSYSIEIQGFSLLGEGLGILKQGKVVVLKSEDHPDQTASTNMAFHAFQTTMENVAASSPVQGTFSPTRTAVKVKNSGFATIKDPLRLIDTVSYTKFTDGYRELAKKKSGTQAAGSATLQQPVFLLFIEVPEQDDDGAGTGDAALGANEEDNFVANWIGRLTERWACQANCPPSVGNLQELCFVVNGRHVPLTSRKMRRWALARYQEEQEHADDEQYEYKITIDSPPEEAMFDASQGHAPGVGAPRRAAAAAANPPVGGQLVIHVHIPPQPAAPAPQYPPPFFYPPQLAPGGQPGAAAPPYPFPFVYPFQQQQNAPSPASSPVPPPLDEPTSLLFLDFLASTYTTAGLFPGEQNAWIRAIEKLKPDLKEIKNGVIYSREDWRKEGVEPALLEKMRKARKEFTRVWKAGEWAPGGEH